MFLLHINEENQSQPNIKWKQMMLFTNGNHYHFHADQNMDTKTHSIWVNWEWLISSMMTQKFDSHSKMDDLSLHLWMFMIKVCLTLIILILISIQVILILQVSSLLLHVCFSFLSFLFWFNLFILISFGEWNVIQI